MEAEQNADNSSFHIEPANKFFEAIRAVADFEVHPGPSVSFIGEVDLTQVEALRQAAPAGQKPSYTAYVAKAVAIALREFPYANRRVCRPPLWLWTRARLQTFHRCDIAFGVERNIQDAESVAYIALVRNVDRLSLNDINQLLRATGGEQSGDRQWQTFSTIIARFPSWLSTLLIRLPIFFPKLWSRYRGGAVLISSPTKYGVDAVFAKVTHPIAIAFGLAKPRPVVKDGKVVACPTFSLTLNFDRRVMAGAQAARFFKRIVDALEHAQTDLSSTEAA